MAVACRGPAAVAGLLAVLHAGSAFVLLDPDYPPARLASMVAAAGVRAIVATEPATALPWLETHPDVGCVVLSPDCWTDETQDRAAAATLQPTAPQPLVPAAADAAAETLAYLHFTSGSTSVQPKAVAAHAGGLLNRFRWMLEDAFPVAPDDVCCQKTSFAFVDAIFETLGPVAAGTPLVMLPRSGN